MAKRERFWLEHNAWWRAATDRLVRGTMSAKDWDEANRRLWCLSQTMPSHLRLTAEDRQDLVQSLQLRLQRPGVLRRLADVDTPAHYLARAMRNLLLTEQDRAAATRRAARRHAKVLQDRQTDERPDQILLQKERSAKARFVVYHVLPRRDREVLGLYYWDDLPAAAIAGRLGISEVAVWQRLVRARARVKQQYGK